MCCTIFDSLDVG